MLQGRSRAAQLWRILCGGMLTWGLSLALSASGLAQSETGRHRLELPGSEAPSRWAVSAGAGVMTSGDIFDISVLSGSEAGWLAPGGGSFNSSEFRVTMDEDFQIGAQVAYLLGRHWWLRLDLSWSEVDATAEARVGQTVELHLYDRLAFLMGGLVVERTLVRAPSYPYLVAGLVMVGMTAGGAQELDQTRVGGRFGIGFHQVLDGRWSLRGEIRDTILQLDIEDHRPQTVSGLPVATRITELGPQNLFELGISIQGTF